MLFILIMERKNMKIFSNLREWFKGLSDNKKILVIAVAAFALVILVAHGTNAQDNSEIEKFINTVKEERSDFYYGCMRAEGDKEFQFRAHPDQAHLNCAFSAFRAHPLDEEEKKVIEKYKQDNRISPTKPELKV